jgi:hypothetical protein
MFSVLPHVVTGRSLSKMRVVGSLLSFEFS